MSEKPTIDKIKRARKPVLAVVEPAAAAQPIGVSPVAVMPGDPERRCGTCEHFDLKSATCHNGISGRLTTKSWETCVKGWYPCTTRWPLHKRMGIEP
jgi:hypothetical protein